MLEFFRQLWKEWEEAKTLAEEKQYWEGQQDVQATTY